MSRKNSRCAISARNSRGNSVEPLDTLEEEPEFKHFINRHEVLAEDEFENECSGGEERVISPPSSKDRRVSTASYGSQCPSRSWSRRSSPTRGELLRADDEMVTVNRGGITMTIPRNLAHHVPPVTVGHLDDEGRELCDQMCKQGYSPEEIVEFFKTYVSKKMKIEIYMKNFLKNHKTSDKEKMNMIKKMLEGSNMSKKDFLDLVKNQFGAEAQETLEQFMKSGMTMQEAMDAFMKQAEKKEKEELRAKLQQLLDNSNMSKEEIFEALRSQLGSEDQAKIEEMLRQGMTMEDIIKHFTGQEEVSLDRRPSRSSADLNNNEQPGSEFARRMQELMANGNLSEEAMIELMKQQLGAGSRAEMEEMLRQGYSMQEVLDHFMKHGKTEQEEQKALTQRLQAVLNDTKMAKDQAYAFLQENLTAEARKAMNDLLKQGYTMEEVIELFKKHGNDLSGIENALAQITVEFDGEPPDAHLHANRDAFSVVSREDVMARIPFMVPGNNAHTFKEFIEKVKKVVEGKGLTHREILDIMESRMGGSYLTDMRQLRAQHKTLAEVVDFFLAKDIAMRKQAQRIARLKAQAKVDAHVDLKRKEIKQNWGVQISYTYSDENGLHLVLLGVEESGPAWCSGVRPGDTIVTVNDWLITVMDRPHVALHLFQAGANQVKLGIQKPVSALSPPTGGGQIIGVI